MPGTWTRGREPLCPFCRVTPLRARTSRICKACWTQMQRGKLAVPDHAWPEPIRRDAPPAAATIADPLLGYADARAQWEREIGLAQARYAGAPASTATAGKLDVAVLCDIHAPFAEPGLLAEAITANRGADLVILAGDVSDAYSHSRFVQYEHVPFRDEWAAVQATLEMICETFPRVRLVLGNHDTRLEKQILTRLTADMADAVRWMCGGTLCPLTMLARHYFADAIEIVPHVTDDGHEMPWLTTVGDAIVMHAEKYSRVPVAAMRGIEEWLADNEGQFSFDRYRLIVQAHTHQQSRTPWRSDKLLVEPGCLCRTQGYMTGPKIGGRPQRRGWARWTQYGGVTDLNSVHVHWADQQRRIA